MKLIKLADVRDIVALLDNQEITFSKASEMLNDIAISNLKQHEETKKGLGYKLFSATVGKWGIIIKALDQYEAKEIIKKQYPSEIIYRFEESSEQTYKEWVERDKINLSKNRFQ